MSKVNEIKTLSDLQMTVSIADVNIIDAKGKRRAPNEIAFLLHGYDPATGKQIESNATISLKEAIWLSKILSEFIGTDEGLDMINDWNKEHPDQPFFGDTGIKD